MSSKNLGLPSGEEISSRLETAVDDARQAFEDVEDEVGGEQYVDVAANWFSSCWAVAKRTQLRELPALRHAVAAGEPLNPEVVRLWRASVGIEIHDGYGRPRPVP